MKETFFVFHSFKDSGLFWLDLIRIFSRLPVIDF